MDVVTELSDVNVRHYLKVGHILEPVFRLVKRAHRVVVCSCVSGTDFCAFVLDGLHDLRIVLDFGVIYLLGDLRILAGGGERRIRRVLLFSTQTVVFLLLYTLNVNTLNCLLFISFIKLWRQCKWTQRKG